MDKLPHCESQRSSPDYGAIQKNSGGLRSFQLHPANRDRKPANFSRWIASFDPFHYTSRSNNQPRTGSRHWQVHLEVKNCSDRRYFSCQYEKSARRQISGNADSLKADSLISWLPIESDRCTQIVPFVSPAIHGLWKCYHTTSAPAAGDTFDSGDLL